MPKNKKLKEIVGQNVKAIMAAKKLSQPKVAAAAKKSGTPIDQTSVGRIARADFPATLDTLEAIANGLGVPAWQLLFMRGNEQKNGQAEQKLLEILNAWEQSGEHGKKLLELAARGALERDALEAVTPAGGGPADVAQPRRGRAS